MIRKRGAAKAFFGIIAGNSSAGKTCAGMTAFPDALKIACRPAAIDPGPKSFAAHALGIELPRGEEDGFEWDAPRDDENHVLPEHYQDSIDLFNRLKEYGQAYLKKHGKPGLPRVALAKALGLEQPFCQNFSTVYFADFSFLLFDMLAAKKQANGGRGNYDSNEEIVQLIKLPTELRAATGLNVVIDMHWDATKYLSERPADPKKDTKVYKPKASDPVQWAAGPSSPFGRMKNIVGYSDFCVLMSSNAAGVRSVRLQGDSLKELIKIQYWSKAPEKFAGRHVVQLTGDVSLRSVLQDYGYPIKDNPELFAPKFIEAWTEKRGPERFGPKEQKEEESKSC